MIKLIRTAVAGIIFATSGAAASAQQKEAKPPRRPVIINDPSVFRPPPPPHERTYVGPGPTVTPPMQRLPKVEPLAQPPIR
ncbi:MAG: hypothetical protein HC869_02615 [Rhodospirillales bacterium]|nr:hypothetical protein [Rhodospirillales bacterium]